MKINPIGIQSYQQLNNKNNQPTKNVDNNNLLKPNDEKITIKPQDSIDSKIAVKAQNSSFADYLSPEEKNVLDILFNKFKDTDRFGNAFKQDNIVTKQNNLGSTIDLKV